MELELRVLDTKTIVHGRTPFLEVRAEWVQGPDEPRMPKVVFYRAKKDSEVFRTGLIIKGSLAFDESNCPVPRMDKKEMERRLAHDKRPIVNRIEGLRSVVASLDKELINLHGRKEDGKTWTAGDEAKYKTLIARKEEVKERIQKESQLVQSIDNKLASLGPKPKPKQEVVAE